MVIKENFSIPLYETIMCLLTNLLTGLENLFYRLAYNFLPLVALIFYKLVILRVL
jgi:hypothetical protein